MPIYEYRCLDCGVNFEFFILSKGETPVCTKCGSKRLERLISSCMVQGSSPSQSACSSCNSLSCSSCGVKPGKPQG